MMQEIIKMVASKAGISEAVAKIAVDTVVNQLKDKLPAGIGTQVASVLDGKTQGESDNPLGGVANALGGIFGKK